MEKRFAYLPEAVENDPADPLAYAGLALGYVEICHSPEAGRTKEARIESGRVRPSTDAFERFGRRTLHARWSKGRNGHYAYYYCQRQCRAVNVSKATLDGAFVDGLALLQPTPGYMRLVKDRILHDNGTTFQPLGAV